MALFPPVIASSMPAFDARSSVKIYFTLSNYNGIKRDQIKQVHVSIRHQNTNASVVKNPSDIIIKDFDGIKNYDQQTKRYYITVQTSEVTEGFRVGTFYKVQLRFASIAYTGLASDTVAQSLFLNDQVNMKSFSEWSTVCIIKPINIPNFYITEFEADTDDDTPVDQDTGAEAQDDIVANVNYFTYPFPQFTGAFSAIDKSQVLKAWRARLLKSSYYSGASINDYTLADTDWKIASAYNYDSDANLMYLDCNLSYQLENNINYKLLFEIETKNGYTGSKMYLFKYFPQSVSKLTGRLTTAVNEEEGYIKLSYTSRQSITSNMCIRRTDSRSNFTVWEDLKNFEAKRLSSFVYYDFTAQSGIAYRYFVQKRDARGRRGTPLYDDVTLQGRANMGEWEHAMLLQSNVYGDIASVKQLKLKYDFSISSWKTNIAESKTDTMGSQFPYIRRNGSMNYKSFPFTGTITSFMDNVDLFTSQEEINDDNNFIYKEFRPEEGYYNKQYDYTYERKFREKVEAFLCNSKVKLFKSMQEGNLLVKLMDVSLTPKQELGRLIYTFSATAYEIDQATIKNFDKHGIIDVGTFSPQIQDTIQVFGQINSYNVALDDNSNVFKAGYDLIGTVDKATAASNSLRYKYHYDQTIDGQKVNSIKVNWIRIQVESPPYLIAFDQSTNKYIPIETGDTNISSYLSPSNTPKDILYQIGVDYNTSNSQSIFLGTLFTIGDQQIIISYPNTIYTVADDDLKITKIIPAKDTELTFDYRAFITSAEDLGLVPNYIEVSPLAGQLTGTFSKEVELLVNMKYKFYRPEFYDKDNRKIVQYINSISDITIDTEPGTVVQLEVSENEQLERFVVNETGEIHFNPCDDTVTIQRLYITGRNVPYTFLHKDRTMDLYDLEDDTLDLKHIDSPVEGDYCTHERLFYIFYLGRWCKATKQDYTNVPGQCSYDLDCSVDALVFWQGVLRRDIYITT